jgi:hypothetical protein
MPSKFHDFMQKDFERKNTKIPIYANREGKTPVS